MSTPEISSPGRTSSSADARLGETLVREGLITDDELRAAMAKHTQLKQQGVSVPLRDLLVGGEALPPAQAEQIRAFMTERVPFADAGPKTVLLTPAPGAGSAASPTHPVAHPRAVEDARDKAGRPFGRYRLVEELGHGGMGIVWKAWDTSLKRTVALKMVLAARSPSRAYLDRFLQESRLAAKLKHPGIVGVYDVGEFDGQHYFTTDYIEGVTLGKQMEEPIPLLQAAEWMRQIAAALHYAHGEGVVHRDIKPDNILIDSHDQAHLTDFGLAKDVELERDPLSRPLTVSGALVGTPEYMSPEQASGESARQGPAADQFSLGVVFYEVLTGEKPFTGRSLRDTLNAIHSADPVRPSARNGAIDRDLETICLRALEKIPARRYPDLGAMAADLARRLAGEAILARPLAWPARLARFAARRKAIVVPSVVAALLSIAGAAWSLHASMQRAEQVRAILVSAEKAETSAAAAGAMAPEKAYAEARDLYRSVLAIEAGQAAAQTGLARVEKQLEAIALAQRKAAEDRASAAADLDSAHRKLSDVQAYLYQKNASYTGLTRLLDPAQELIERALARVPDSVEGRFLLGRAWDLKGFNDKAEASYRRAIALDPGYGPVRFWLGHLLLFRAFFATGEPDDEDSASGFAEGARLFALGKLEIDASFQDPRTAATEDEPRLWHEAGDALAAGFRGQLPDPLVHCRKALALEGVRGKEEIYLLVATFSPGPEHLDYLNQALDLRPRFPLALFYRAMAYEGMRNLDAAIADYSAALEVNPRLAEAWVNRGLLRRAKGDLDGAIADFSTALDVDPNMVWAHDGRGYALQMKGDLEGAQSDFDPVVAARPKWTPGWVHRGRLHHARGNLAGAIDDYTKAIELAPGNPSLLALRGRILLERGAWQEAATDLTHAFEIAPAEWAMREGANALLDRADKFLKAQGADKIPEWARRVFGAQAALEFSDFAAARTGYEEGLGAVAEGGLSDPDARPILASAHYNLACIYARQLDGRMLPDRRTPAPTPDEVTRLTTRCFGQLLAAIDCGFSDATFMEKDTDLEPVHNDARWKKVMERLRK